MNALSKPLRLPISPHGQLPRIIRFDSEVVHVFLVTLLD